MENKILKSTLTLTLITFLIGLLIVSINSLTEDKIQSDASARTTAKYEEVFPEATEFKDITNDGKSRIGNVTKVLEAKNGATTVGYLYESHQNGYSSDIEVLTSINSATSDIRTVSILKAVETPGLGEKAKLSPFTNQYMELKGTAPVIVVKAPPKKENNEIQAITASTITSSAVTTAVNYALEDFTTNYGTGGTK